MSDLLTELLVTEGYQVTTAVDGRDALDHITHDLPALVLLDLQMPGLTGQQMLAELHTAGVAVPVVVMSAGERADRAARAHGATGHLAKPFAFDEVVALAERFAAPPER